MSRQLPAAAAPVLLELHCAVGQAAHALKRSDRARLELATRDVILAARMGGLVLVPASEAGVLEALREILHLASVLRVDWSSVVAIVNREE